MTLTSYLILKSQVSTILNVVPGLKQFAQKELRVGAHREISLVLCDHLEGWDREGGRETQEGGDMGMYVYI